MSGKPPVRRASKFLGAFSLGTGIAQIAAPERINHLIGVKDTPKTRTVQRLIGVQELSAGQGIFSFSPPTPVLWSRVAGDLLHLGLLGKALDNKRNDRTKLRNTIAAVVGIGVLDALVASRYQSRWPKEPTGVEPLPTTRGEEEPMTEHYEGHPAVTILATEAEIRPRLRELEIDGYGEVEFRTAPGDRGTEVIVKTAKKTDTVKAELRKVKQLIEVGEIVRSDAAPDGTSVKRQLTQRPGQPLSVKELEKAGRA
jgi:ribosomal protein L30/L7E